MERERETLIVSDPTRQSMYMMGTDLMTPGLLPLLIATPNGRSATGVNREKSIPNPHATSSEELSMFEFLGKMMGVAVRTRVRRRLLVLDMSRPSLNSPHRRRCRLTWPQWCGS